VCGLVGVVQPSGDAPIEDVRAALPLLRHRGPEASATRAFRVGTGSCALGHTRLRIVDTSERADQPLGNEDGTVWVGLNGELYNHRELRRDLQEAGHDFATTSDTEALVHLYEQVDGDPDSLLTRLRGMYAFVIVDQARGRVLLGRDRLGIKPLYLAATRAGGLAFASEARALAGSGIVPSGPDSASLVGYALWGSVQGSRTAYAGVEELTPGSYLSWTPSGSEVRTWWTPSFDASLGERDAEASLGEAVRDSVSRHVDADREVGLFLSGGVDSSSVAAMASRGAAGIRSLTVTFPDGEDDEGFVARRGAAQLGLQHEQVPVTGADVAASITVVARAMDQPTADGVNSWVVSQAAARMGLVVALSGLGGDELFGGYPTFEMVPRVARLDRALYLVPGGARRRLADALAARQPGGRAGRMLASTVGMAHAYRAVRGLFSPQDLDRLGVLPWLGAREADLLFTPPEPPGGEAADRVALLELTRYMRNQLLRDTDQMSMAHSIEVRVPLLDDRVLDAAFAVAPHVRNRPNKALLQRAAGIAVEGPKQGFTLPFDAWMRGPLREWTREALLSDRLPLEWLFERRGREQLWEAFERRRVHWSRPWAIAMLRAWADAHELGW
jgi:asparagine synthase (glutamine-hydrolysing)